MGDFCFLHYTSEFSFLIMGMYSFYSDTYKVIFIRGKKLFPILKKKKFEEMAISSK